MTGLQQLADLPSQARRKAKAMAAALALALPTSLLDAQISNLGPSINLSDGLNLIDGPYKTASRNSMVRYGSYLYVAAVGDDGRVQIRRKLDDPCSLQWATFIGLVNIPLNGVSTGFNPLPGIPRANAVAMAVSSSGCLEITWGCYTSKAGEVYFQQYFRCYKIGVGFTYAPQDITVYSPVGILGSCYHGAWGGNTTSQGSDSMAIAVGPNDEVYMTCRHDVWGNSNRLYVSSSSWVAGCPPLNQLPVWRCCGLIPEGAPGNNGFPASLPTPSHRSPMTRMVVDSSGRVQMAFWHDAISNATDHYATRVYDPNGTMGLRWSTLNPLEYHTSPGLFVTGCLATDTTGATHLLYMNRTIAGFDLLYKSRLGAGSWSIPIVVATTTNTELGSNTPLYSFALAAFHDGSRVFAIYRDYACQRLMMKQKKSADNHFEFISVLTEPSPPGLGLNDANMPNVLSTLFPVPAVGNPLGNQLRDCLDISFHRPASLIYPFTHKRLQISRMEIDLTGCPGSCGVPAITLGGVPCTTTCPRSIEVGCERAAAGATAFLVMDFPNPIIPINMTSYGCSGCYTYASKTWTMKTVTPCCTLAFTYNFGFGCLDLDCYLQWIVWDTQGLCPWSFSNRGKIKI